MPKNTNVPRYQQTKTNFQPITATGEAQVWGDLAQRLGQWQNRAFQAGAEQAKERGAASGAAEGAKPGVPEVEESPWSIEQKAHRDAALMGHKARIQSDVRDQVAQLEAEHPLDPEGFNAALQGYREGLTGEVHPGIRSDVELLFDDYGGRSDARININVTQQAYKDDIQAILNEAGNLNDEALRYARDGDEAGLIQTEAKMSSMLNQAVKSKLITPEDANARVQALTDKALQEVMIGEFERTLYSEGIPAAEEQFLQFRETDTTKLDLDPKEKDMIETRMRASINAEYARLNREKTEDKANIAAVEKMIADDVKDTIYLMEHGRFNEDSKKTLDRLLVMSQGTKFEDPLREAVESYQAVDAFNRMGVRDQEAFIDHTKATGQSSGDDTRILMRLNKVHEGRLNQLKNGEGLEMYYQDGYAPPPESLNFQDEEALRVGLRSRSVSATKAAQIYQHQVSPLRPAEISSLNQYFEAAGAADQLRLLGMLEEEFGQNYLPAMEQIDKQGGRGLAMAGGVYNMSGPTGARLALQGQEARAAKVVPKLETFSEASLQQDLNKAVRAIPNDKHRGATKDLIRNIYDGMTVAEKDITGVYNNDRMKQAVELGMGGSHRWEGSKWGAQESFITPPVVGWTQDQTEDWFDEEMSADEVRLMGDPAGFTAETFLTNFRKFGVLVPLGMTNQPGRASKTRYSVLFNNFPVKNTDGTLFVMEYQDQ